MVFQAQHPVDSYRPTSMQQPQQEYRQIKAPLMPQQNAARYENPQAHQYDPRQNAPSVNPVAANTEKLKAQAAGPPDIVNEEKKLSKSQKAKLRKKMREGRM